MTKFRVTENTWETHFRNGFGRGEVKRLKEQLKKINSGIKEANERIKQVDQMSGISYSDQGNKIDVAITHLEMLESYVKGSIQDVTDILDDEIFEAIQGPSGAVEELELVADKEYQTKNTVGLQKEVTINDSYAYQHGYVSSPTRIEKRDMKMIGFEDLLGKESPDTVKNLTTFSKLFRDSYESLKEELKEQMPEDYTLETHLEWMVQQGKFDHSVDSGWKSWVSTALDAVGIVSIVSKFTGNDFVTGERYKQSEKDSATFNIIMSAVGLLTLGIGQGVTLTAKEITKLTLKYIVIEMTAAVAAKGTQVFLDECGAPEWLQMLSSIVVQIGVGNKLEKMAFKPNSLEELLKKGITGAGDLKKLGIKDMDDLYKIGVHSMDDLAKLGITTVEDLAKLGIKNAEDLVKYGIGDIDEAIEFFKRAEIEDIAKLTGKSIEQIDELLKKGMSVEELKDALKTKDIDDILKGASIDDIARLQYDEFGNLTVPTVADYFEGADEGLKRLGNAEFYSVQNINGGDIHVSTAPVVQGDFVDIVNNADGNVNLLTGVHGNIDGTITPHSPFYTQDVGKWGDVPNVNIINITELSSDALASIVNSADTTVCAWCNSERTEIILQALGLKK